MSYYKLTQVQVDLLNQLGVQVNPGTEDTLLDILTELESSKLTIKIDEVDSDTTYVGYADPGTLTSASTWRIKKILTVGTVTTISFASGVTTFTKEWDERTSYIYS